MEEDKEKQFLPAPITGNLFSELIASLLSNLFYFLLVADCIAIVCGVTIKPYLSTKIVFFFDILLVSSIVIRNRNADWLDFSWVVLADNKFRLTGTRSQGTDVQVVVHNKISTQLKSMFECRDLCLAAGGLFTAYLVAEIVELFAVVGRSGGLANDLLLAVCVSALFPLGAAFAMQLRNKGARIFSMIQMPNLSYGLCYAGLTNLILMSSYLPNGIGAKINGWLNTCIISANMPASAEPSLAMQFVISTLVFVALMSAFRHSMIRFSAGYQLFVKRVIVFKDSWLDALRTTLQIKPIRIDVPDQHPHLHDASSTALWVGFIYLLLFSIVGFCPGPIGDTIRLYYQDCLDGANIGVNLQANWGLLEFIASVVAAYATIPVAVMSCSFLSAKQTQYILASSEGVLVPCDAKTLIGYSPLLQWEKLNRISLEKANDENKRYLKFSFDKANPIELRISGSRMESLAALLNAADEYSKKCLIEKPVLDLRKQINDEVKSQTMAQTKRFSSTVFSLSKTGDDLNGNYRVVRKLAGKSLSAVYLARDGENELVIVKEFVLPENVDACDELDADFKREYNTLKELEHPGIAKIIESFEERNAKYLVIEHIVGTDLRELVNKTGPRSEASVKALALSIASIMSYLHSREPAILHRDLTPDNLMISNDGILKLIDFGASHQFIEGITGTLIGKQCYIAPEQLRGKASIESDIYSFGCTLYFLLTGSDPKALQQSDPETSNVSPAFRELIRKCTEFEPQNRLHSFAQIIALIEPSRTHSVPSLEASYGS